MTVTYDEPIPVDTDGDGVHDSNLVIDDDGQGFSVELLDGTYVDDMFYELHDVEMWLTEAEFLSWVERDNWLRRLWEAQYGDATGPRRPPRPSRNHHWNEQTRSWEPAPPIMFGPGPEQPPANFPAPRDTEASDFLRGRGLEIAASDAEFFKLTKKERDALPDDVARDILLTKRLWLADTVAKIKGRPWFLALPPESQTALLSIVRSFKPFERTDQSHDGRNRVIDGVIDLIEMGETGRLADPRYGAGFLRDLAEMSEGGRAVDVGQILIDPSRRGDVYYRGFAPATPIDDGFASWAPVITTEAARSMKSDNFGDGLTDGWSWYRSLSPLAGKIIYASSTTASLLDPNREILSTTMGRPAGEAVGPLSPQHRAIDEFGGMEPDATFPSAMDHNSRMVDHMAAKGLETGIGNCITNASALALWLWHQCHDGIEIFQWKDGDHSFLVLGRDLTSDPSDSSTWGDNWWVLDPWDGPEGRTHHNSLDEVRGRRGWIGVWTYLPKLVARMPPKPGKDLRPPLPDPGPVPVDPSGWTTINGVAVRVEPVLGDAEPPEGPPLTDGLFWFRDGDRWLLLPEGGVDRLIRDGRVDPNNRPAFPGQRTGEIAIWGHQKWTWTGVNWWLTDSEPPAENAPPGTEVVWLGAPWVATERGWDPVSTPPRPSEFYEWVDGKWELMPDDSFRDLAPYHRHRDHYLDRIAPVVEEVAGDEVAPPTAGDGDPAPAEERDFPWKRWLAIVGVAIVGVIVALQVLGGDDEDDVQAAVTTAAPAQDLPSDESPPATQQEDSVAVTTAPPDVAPSSIPNVDPGIPSVSSQQTFGLNMSNGRVFPIFDFVIDGEVRRGIVMDPLETCWIVQYGPDDADGDGDCPPTRSAPLGSTTHLMTGEQGRYVVELRVPDGLLAVSDLVTAQGLEENLGAQFFVRVEVEGPIEVDGEVFNRG